MRRRAAWSGLALAFVLASTSIAPPVHADDPTPEALDEARKSFKEGLDAEKAGDYGAALEHFQKTAKVKMTAQVRFHIALCKEKLKQYIGAMEDYEAAAKQAGTDGNTEVLKAAPLLLEKLEARTPRLTITFADNIVPDTLTLDGKAIDKTPREPMFVDPGKHVLVAKNPGQPEFSEEFVAADNDDKWIAVKVGPKIDTPTKDEGGAAGNGSSKRTIGLVVAGAGVVSVGLGFVFFAVRSSAVSDLATQCVELRCPPSAGPTLDRARTFNTLSGVAFGVGIVSIGVGAYLFLTGKKDEAPAPPKSGKIEFVPYAPQASVGLGLVGAF